MNCRKRRDDVKTRGLSLIWEKSERRPVYYSDGVRHEGGVNPVQALVWNVGTCIAMRREKLKRPTRESWSTEAECRGGVACSSEEGSVTGLELRRNIVQLYRKVNRKRRSPFWTKQSPGAFLSDGSGMLING